MIKNLIKKSIIICAIFGISGCDNPELLQNVDSLALVSVRFNREITDISQKNWDSENFENTESVDLLGVAGSIVGKKSKKTQQFIEAITPNDVEFFNGFTNRLEKRINESPLTLEPVSSFSENNIYKTQENMEMPGKLNELYNKYAFYTPAPYVYHDLFSNVLGKKNKQFDSKVKAQTLANALNVDAVGAFDFEFVNIKGKKHFILPSNQLACVGKLIVRNKDGELIFNKTIKVVSKKSFNLSFEIIDGVTIPLNDKSAKQFKELEDKFFAKIDKLIKKALAS